MKYFKITKTWAVKAETETEAIKRLPHLRGISRIRDCHQDGV